MLQRNHRLDTQFIAKLLFTKFVLERGVIRRVAYCRWLANQQQRIPDVDKRHLDLGVNIYEAHFAMILGNNCTLERKTIICLTTRVIKL